MIDEGFKYFIKNNVHEDYNFIINIIIFQFKKYFSTYEK